MLKTIRNYLDFFEVVLFAFLEAEADFFKEADFKALVFTEEVFLEEFLLVLLQEQEDNC